jgi:hypothetical protein
LIKNKIKNKKSNYKIKPVKEKANNTENYKIKEMRERERLGMREGTGEKEEKREWSAKALSAGQGRAERSSAQLPQSWRATRGKTPLLSRSFSQPVQRKSSQGCRLSFKAPTEGF